MSEFPAPSDDGAPAPSDSEAPRPSREPSAEPSAELAPTLSPEPAEQAPADAGSPAEPPASFADLALPEPLARAVAELGYEAPTAVQARCIPPLLAGRDLLGQAQTGTGKTAAFALPLLGRVDTTRRTPQVLVLAPTRELALQVAEAFQRYARHLPDFRVVPIYGGQSYTLQIRQLKHAAQVVVGTPGRVMDHMRRGTLSLDGLEALVLDEADEMLNLGFAEDIDWIFEQAPARCQRALFSATLPAAIVKVARARLTDPVEVRVEAGAQGGAAIDQSHCVVTRHHKLDVLTRLLEMEPFDGMVVFVRTKNATLELADKLRAHGFTAEALNGDMSQELRERAVERLRRGQLDIVVATDVAARGLDVERVTHVVNYDIPTDPQTYIHRIGRTGRAGRSGRAILLVEPRERGLLRAIERTTQRPVARIEPPSAEQLTNSRIERFTGELRTTLAEQDLDFFYRLVTDIAHEQELEPIDIAAGLAYQLQKERPLEAEELPRPTTRPVHRRERHERDDRPERERRERRDTRPGRDDRFERGPRERRDGDERRPRSRDEGRPERRGDGYRERGDVGDRDMPDMVGYRIEVGHDHGVTPREIVGAIANEAELAGRYIGRIDIGDDYSTVDLPAGMPNETLQHLKRVYVRGQALRITELGPDEQDQRPRRQSRPRDFGPRDRDRRQDERPRRYDRERDERPARRFRADDDRGARYRPGGDRDERRPRGERDEYRPRGQRDEYRPRGERGEYRPRGERDDSRPRDERGGYRPRGERDDSRSSGDRGGYRPRGEYRPGKPKRGTDDRPPRKYGKRRDAD